MIFVPVFGSCQMIIILDGKIVFVYSAFKNITALWYRYVFYQELTYTKFFIMLTDDFCLVPDKCLNPGALYSYPLIPSFLLVCTATRIAAANPVFCPMSEWTLIVIILRRHAEYYH